METFFVLVGILEFNGWIAQDKKDPIWCWRIPCLGQPHLSCRGFLCKPRAYLSTQLFESFWILLGATWQPLPKLARGMVSLNAFHPAALERELTWANHHINQDHLSDGNICSSLLVFPPPKKTLFLIVYLVLERTGWVEIPAYSGWDQTPSEGTSLQLWDYS